jgi:hypothetical protein
MNWTKVDVNAGWHAETNGQLTTSDDVPRLVTGADTSEVSSSRPGENKKPARRTIDNYSNQRLLRKFEQDMS